MKGSLAWRHRTVVPPVSSLSSYPEAYGMLQAISDHLSSLIRFIQLMICFIYQERLLEAILESRTVATARVCSTAFLKVRVHASLLGRYTTGGVIHKHQL
jgi:hypothetical protein